MGLHPGSFSMARHHNVPGQPGPVRDKLNIYGLPGNSPQQQAEADKGIGCPASMPAGLEGVPHKRTAPWTATRFWLKAPGDDSEGGQKFVPQDNIFEHLATR